MRFRTKLILITSVTVLAVGLAAVAVLQYSISRFNRLLYDQTAYSLDIVAAGIATELEKLDELSRTLAVSQEFQKNLLNYNTLPTGFERTTAHKNINTIFYRTLTSPIIQMTIHTPDGRTLDWGRDSSPEQPALLAQAKQLCDQAAGASVWLPTGRADNSVLLCRKVLQVSGFSLQNMGYLILRVDLDKIVRQATVTRTSFDYEFSVSIFDGGYQPVYSTLAPLPQWSGSSDIYPDAPPYIIATVDHQRTFLVYAKLPAFTQSWFVELGIPYNQIAFNIVLSNILYLLLILAAIILLIWVASLATKSLSTRFNLLVTKMERLKSGNFELLPHPPSQGNDELTLLNRYFDEMTVEFKHTIEDNYVKELLIAQAQLKSLEQQINPHFLYNTLQSVSCLARNNGENNIVLMVEALANLLRNGLDHTTDVITIEQELSILQSYVQIQQIRFGAALSVNITADASLLSAQIPKMTIQPLVENAIVYAMDELVELCTVQVTVARQGDEIQLMVENNGSHIDEDILAHLRDKTVTPKGNGIGLHNIDARIKLIFGEPYGLSFRNLGDGVLATVTLPCVKEVSTCSN